MAKSIALKWIKAEFSDAFMSRGSIRASNLATYHMIENEANGISDINDGNQINLINAPLQFEGKFPGSDSIRAKRVYQGPKSNDIYIFSMSKPVYETRFHADMAYDGRRCFQINQLQKFFARFKSAIAMKCVSFHSMCEDVRYYPRYNNSMYDFDKTPHPTKMVFSKPLAFAYQHEVRIAIYTNGSEIENTREMSYEPKPMWIDIELGNLTDLCFEVTEQLCR